MSGLLMGEVLTLALKGSHREVLLSLANRAWDDGSEARPGLALLAYETGLSRRQVIRTLQDLERMGCEGCTSGQPHAHQGVIVEVSYPKGGRGADGKGKATEYQLHLERAPKKPPFKDNSAEMSPFKGDELALLGAAGPSKGDKSASNGAISPSKGDISASKGDMAEIKSAHQRPLNPSGEPSGEPSISGIPDAREVEKSTEGRRERDVGARVNGRAHQETAAGFQAIEIPPLTRAVPERREQRYCDSCRRGYSVPIGGEDRHATPGHQRAEPAELKAAS